MIAWSLIQLDTAGKAPGMSPLSLFTRAVPGGKGYIAGVSESPPNQTSGSWGESAKERDWRETRDAGKMRE